LKKSYHKFI